MKKKNWIYYLILIAYCVTIIYLIVLDAQDDPIDTRSVYPSESINPHIQKNYESK